MQPPPQVCIVLPCIKCGKPLEPGTMTPAKRLRSWRTGELVAVLWRHDCRETYAEKETER